MGSVIAGASRPEHVATNAAASEWVPSADMTALDAIAPPHNYVPLGAAPGSPCRMKVAALIQRLAADAGWRIHDFLKLTLDDGRVGWSEFSRAFAVRAWSPPSKPCPSG